MKKNGAAGSGIPAFRRQHLSTFSLEATILRYRTALAELCSYGYRSVEITGWRVNLTEYLGSLIADGPECMIEIGDSGIARILPSHRAMDPDPTAAPRPRKEPFAVVRR